MKHRRITAVLTALASLCAALPHTPLTVTAADSINPDTELPYAFDLRELGLVSTVKNQSPYGTCWAHGTMGSLESRMIADDPDIDLSEWHLALFSHMGESGLSGETDTEQILNYGGIDDNTSAILLNRVGPMLEQDFPYDGPIPDVKTPIKQMQKNAAAEVTAFHKYTAWENNSFVQEPLEIKKLLYSGVAPAVTVSACLLQQSCFSYEYNSVYAPPDQVSELAAENDANTSPHVMTLVGWDDNFPKEHFVYQPPRDGAWLIKNSWGKHWADCGYVWISYADETVGGFTWYDIRPASDHDQFFSYDNCGEAGLLSVSLKNDDTEARYANVFVPEEDCCLTDLMLCPATEGDTLVVTVYTNLQDRNDPSSGTAAPSAVYEGLPAGYQEVALPQGIPVKAGEPFAVTVRATGNAGPHIPCELGMEDYTLVKDKTGYLYGNFHGAYLSVGQMKKYFGRQESFISTDGKTWTDTADVTKITNIANYKLIIGNVCVRAWGVNAGRVKFSDEHEELPLGKEIALSSAEGADIYYKIDDGDYQLYTEPFPFTGEMTVSAYADTGSKTVYTKHFSQRHAVLSSMLINDDTGWSYADLTRSEIPVRSEFSGSYIQPISTGKITVNGEPLISGHKFALATDENYFDIRDKEYILRVEQEGMLPTEYHLIVNKISKEPIPNGLYTDDLSMSVCEFRGGKYTEKDLTDGKVRQTGTYTQNESGKWDFELNGNKIEYSVAMFFNQTDGCRKGNMILRGEDGSYRQLTYLNPLSLAAHTLYPTGQLEKYVLPAYKNYTGKNADKVVMTDLDEARVILDFYQNNKKTDTLFCDHFGLMYTSDMKPVYYALPQYRRADLNGDKALNIADAVMLQRLVTEDAPEKEPSQTALAAADLDGDGILTVQDTLLLIDMLNRKSNNHA